MKKTLWIILIAFVLGTFATVSAIAAPGHAGKAGLHQSATVKGKKHHHKKHKKHHKKNKGAKRNAK